VIVVATEAERASFLLDSDNVILTGVGYPNVYRALEDIPRDTPITNVGYAGSNSIAKGTTCVIGACRHYHPNVEYDEPEYKLNGGTYICYTSDDFVLHTDITEPVVFDMELYAILSMGFTNVTAIKIISDNLSLEEYENITNC
jgi:hypothetical protein